MFGTVCSLGLSAPEASRAWVPTSLQNWVSGTKNRNTDFGIGASNIWGCISVAIVIEHYFSMSLDHICFFHSCSLYGRLMDSTLPWNTDFGVGASNIWRCITVAVVIKHHFSMSLNHICFFHPCSLYGWLMDSIISACSTHVVTAGEWLRVWMVH